MLLAACIGLRFHKPSSWLWVDCLYYPLVAVSVWVLFQNNAGERQVIEINEQKTEVELRYSELAKNQPAMSYNVSEDLYRTSLELLTFSSIMNKSCGSFYSPECEAARTINPPIEKFINEIAPHRKEAIEKRIISTCNAAQNLLLEFEKEGELLSSTTNYLIKGFREISQKKLGIGAYGAIPKAQQELEQASLEDLQMLDKAVYSRSNVGQFIKETREAQIRNASSMLQGLLPCMAADMDQLKAVNEWKEKSESTLKIIDRQNIELRAAKSKVDIAFYRFQLYYWPYIIIFALSLKLAKAAAGIRPQINAILILLYDLKKRIFRKSDEADVPAE
ncbi:hypothetical protein CRN80_24160 [Pseudomonas sp. FDAARGOS_380]|uniref:hypothetical protein n=1 Tax=unclassified Pseudomonas TaxID=196821 RepID=UPI000BFCBE1A|nr:MULTISPECIES: hypothetical protein [unclassified Pseudomonas]ATN12543.1 hypothetical protein CRN80_24160 [Pseudomonas sp. FDAARGOS_380]NMX26452.1 hypothetical protein [Pseudomonas sp. WS 5406]